MPNENNQPKRRQHGPGMGPAPAEKAKNFKSAISGLFKELKSFHILILVALILAALSSVLSIISPNKLSDLTDEISKGLVIKTDVMKWTLGSVLYNPEDGSMIIPNMGIGIPGYEKGTTSSP